MKNNFGGSKVQVELGSGGVVDDNTAGTDLFDDLEDDLLVLLIVAFLGVN